ncbi:hypothetical protein R5R35_003113 [Gryllus longicercus]|uniref:BZIP domain-containing protein n=1 Tax=Gryllus longicercus TaxID=2509291 RepID=A0AAN9Z6B9_9ORTH
MADESFSGDIFMDPGFLVKQEQVSMDTSSSMTASVPIPPRKVLDLSELRDFGFELDTPSPSASQDRVPTSVTGLCHPLTGPLWGAKLNTDSPSFKAESFRMDDDDDDDIFQVDKADLIQGPTLAELNANDENLLDDLNFDDLLLPEENTYYLNVPCVSPQPKSITPFEPPVVQITNTNNNVINNNQTPNSLAASSFPPAGFGFYKDSFLSSSVPSSPLDVFSKTVNSAVPSVGALSPTSQHSSSSSLLLQSAASSITPPLDIGVNMKHSTLHELLMKKETSGSPFGGSKSMGRSASGHMSSSEPPAGSPGLSVVPGSSRVARSTGSYSSRLSSSAPTHLGLEQIWQRRESRQHLLSTGSLAEAGSTSSISTGGVLSPESHEFSHDEGFDSEDDSDHYEDYSSDGESGSDSEVHMRSSSKKERYFWQYNVQAKGPKGQRLVLKTTLEDPHVLNEVTDPVFSPECSVRGIKHSGKARKGDGNDLTPNPRKLCSIGRELDKLGQIINDMTPVSELPFNVRPKTRKEKNKLASRACRLKKKAQHEANKLKLYGLETEHRRLNAGICQLKQVLVAKCTTDDPEKQEEFTKHIEKIVKQATKLKIAGHTTEFVNKVLEKVKSGAPSGGLDEL